VVVRVAVVAILVVAELRVMTLPLFRKTKEKDRNQEAAYHYILLSKLQI